jgi:secreted Zn-dependent insulinase-like peptidase
MSKMQSVRQHFRRSPRKRVNFELHTDLMCDALWLIVEQALRGEMETG